ncbi:MAG: transglycosylase domain-containing protein [Actinobacteria bacterium]|nr:transglycosylase domain-containing protein [Actinomycetota bacterium]
MAGKTGRPARSDARRATSRATSRAAGRPGRPGDKDTPNRFWNYPRPGYHGIHRWLPSWRIMLASTLGLIFLVLGLVVAAYQGIAVPDPTAAVTDQTTKVYFASEDGTSDRGSLMGTYPGINREIVDYASLPDYVGKAVVASEDRTFFTNSGIDLKGIARAFVNNVSGGAQQGGSTLTQQYVENYYLGATHDYVGKAKEALLAIKIAQTESKDQILGRYLNTIYFGRGAYGIQAAARAYFGVDAKDLTVSQAAMLAGIIPSPGNWDPAVSPDKAQARWARTLDFMVDEGWLTSTDRAAQQFPATVTQQVSSTYAGPNGYLLVMARDAVGTALGLTDEQVMRGGYSIITTVKQSVQNEAVRAAGDLLNGTLADGATPDPKLKIGITSIDPVTGGIVSLYSGQDFLADQVNRVTMDKIQAGSTYKPFTLIAALEKGIPLTTTFSGASPQKIDGWVDKDGKPVAVTNFVGQSFGRIDLVKATEDSVNTVYAQLNVEVGPKSTADVAARAGITTEQSGVLSNVLGSDSVHPLDMASAYGVFAAQGMRVAPHVVSSVLNSTGTTAYTADTTQKRIFAADVMADTTFAMQTVVSQKGGSGYKYIHPLDRTIAGKTGTSTNNKSAWFVGFTTNLVTAVAMSQVADDGKGQDTITPFGGVSQVTGGTWPAALWADYMKPVLAMAPYATDTAFPDRANVGSSAPPTATATATPTAEAPTAAAPTTAVVPDSLTSKLEADASAAVTAVGLVPKIVSEPSATVPAGRVIRTDPGAGATVEMGSEVTLVISTGPPPTPAPTPTVAPTPSVAATPAAGG